MANKPNNPSLWSKAKSLAKQKFDVYPSAYANGWAAKWYKSKGGSWRKAQDGMEVPYMADGGKPEWLLQAQLKAQGYTGDALRQKLDSMADGGIPQNKGFKSLPGYVQEKIINNMAYGGSYMMQAGGNFEPNGEMALGQMAAVQDKMNKLRQFIKSDDNLDPWIASKLAVMDHSADAIADYLMYGAEGDEELEETDEMEETPEMKEGGGIPARYKNMGFTRVGAKRQSNRPGKKWMVLAKKGSKYKVVHGGYKGMKDFSQHHSKKRQTNFWNRMGGKNSSKATDPFSPLYWHKRFGTWKDGGETYNMEAGGMMFREVDGGDISIPNLTKFTMGGYFPRFMEDGGDTGTFSGNAYYQQGGQQQEQLMQIIQAYSQIAQVDPKEIIQKLQQLPPQEQQKVMQKMVQAVQQAQQQQQQAPMMKMGGGSPCYKCGGSYAYGGMTNEMGGSVLPAMPSDVYNLPSYGGGGDYYGYMDPAWMKQGGIHINPANKGKFTASAKRAGMGVQEFASHVLANKEDYSSTQVKRANFARNAAKWKKQDGGSMNMDQVYDLTDEEIQNLINQGYEIQYV